MPFANIDNLCFHVNATPRELCVRFPVGTSICASVPQVNIADSSELLQSLFGSINSALVPLDPIFKIIDAVVSVFECIKAIPKSIATLNPGPLLECLPGLTEAIGSLLALLPQVSLPVMILDIIDAVILYLQTVQRQLDRLKARQEAIIRANTIAAKPGNLALALSLNCIQANFDADIINLNEQVAPLNRLLGVLNFLLEISGLKAILKSVGVEVMPCLHSFSLDTGFDLLGAFINVLVAIRGAIPVPGGLSFSITDRKTC